MCDEKELLSGIEAIDATMEGLVETRADLVAKLMELRHPFRANDIVKFGKKFRGVVQEVNPWSSIDHSGCVLRVILLKKDDSLGGQIRNVHPWDNPVIVGKWEGELEASEC